MKPATSNHAAFAIALALLLAVLLFAAVQPASADPGWYDAEWAYRKPITIPASEVAGDSDLEDFPVLISLTTDSDLAADAQNDGDDILFTSSDETTKLKHEIEEFDGGTGKLIAWVKVNPLSYNSNTVLYMYYGNSKCGSQQDATNVWDTNYKGVWHLKENCDAAGCIKDSTSNNNAGTPNTNLYTSSGKIDGADTFDGNVDYVDFGDITIIDGETSVTFSAWINVDVNDLHGIISKAVADDRSFFFFLNAGTSYPKLSLKAWDGSTSNINLVYMKTDDDAVPVNTWVHAVAHLDLTTHANSYIYVNGVTQPFGITTDGTLPTSIANTASAMEMGRLWSGVYDFDGIIDEVRISNIARTADWIKTEYNNQNDPETFAPAGGEVTNWKSYSDSDRTEEEDDFTTGQNFVYMKGSGFDTTGTYKVAYYDGDNGHSGANGVRRQTDAYSDVATGILDNSAFEFPGSGAYYGTWHAVVYKTGGDMPDTYDLVDPSNAAYVVEANFYVNSEPLPEFPTVVTAIAVCMLCAVAYVVMRRKVGDG